MSISSVLRRVALGIFKRPLILESAEKLLPKEDTVVNTVLARPTPSDKTVKTFNYTLLWPLLIPKKIEQEFFSNLESDPWSSRDAGFFDFAEFMNQDYATFVYFHPFVQAFLLNKEAVQVYQRTGISDLKVTLEGAEKGSDGKKEEINHKLTVSDIFMFCFDTNVVVLSLKLSAIDIPLMDAMNLQDVIRRVYPPYYDDSSVGHCAKAMAWLNNEETLITTNFSSEIKVLPDHVKKDKSAPMTAIWRYLLPKPNCDDLKQIEDDRIPAMSHLSFTDPFDLSFGDHVRLGMYDDAGSSDTLPYSEKILHDFDEKYCYDRFWHEPKDRSATTAYGIDMNTRYIMTGYSFLMIGRDDSSEEYSFFCNVETGALSHFNRHYFILNLIVRFQRASLLALQQRITEALEFIRNDRFTNDFRIEMNAIEIDFLNFSQKYWFSEVSNQIQPQELYDMLHEHTRVKTLYEEVSQEIKQVNEYLKGLADERYTRNANKLAWIATIGFGLSLGLQTFDNNVFYDWTAYWFKRFGVTNSGDLLILSVHLIQGLAIILLFLAAFFFIFRRRKRV